MNSAAPSMTSATGTSHHAMKAKMATRRADRDRHLRQVLAEEGLQLLDAIDHRQHDAAGALRAEPGGAEGDDLVEQPGAQRLLHLRGGAMGDHGAGVVQRRAQQDRHGGAGQRHERNLLLEHAGEEAAKEGEAGDADGQREQAEEGGEQDAASQPHGQAPQLQIEKHAPIVPDCGPAVDIGRSATPWGQRWGQRLRFPRVGAFWRAAARGKRTMGYKIAIMGTGAVGAYAGAHMAQAGEDVTFIDPWPANVETMKADGLKVSHIRDVPEWTTPVRALHLTELQQAAKEQPFDIAFVCMKSYDTEWATTMISQYLAPERVHGFVAELHERGDHRRRGRLGQGGGLHRQLDHRRSVRAGPCAPRRRQKRRQAHGVPHRRGARPHHRPGQGDPPAGLAGGLRAGDHQPVGRALVEAGDQCDGQRHVRQHRPDQQGHPAQRHAAPLRCAPWLRGDPRRPGAGL